MPASGALPRRSVTDPTPAVLIPRHGRLYLPLRRPWTAAGRRPHHALGGRLQELLRQPLVVDRPREDDRADHGREDGHGLAAGLLALGIVNPATEQIQIFPDSGFE